MLVRTVRYGKWLDSPPWLVNGEAPADCLNDFRAGGSELSIYSVPSDASSDQVAIAIAGTRQRFDEAGYIVFDEAIVTELGIAINDAKRGQTPDPVINGWHRDLVELSAGKLAELATRLWAIREDLLDRVLKPKVQEHLVAGVKGGHLDIGRMHEDLRREIERLIEAEQA